MPPLHPFLPVPGVIRVSLEGTQAGRPFANVFHQQYSGDIPASDALFTWVSGWWSQVTTALSNVMHENASFVQAVATDLSSITGAQTAAGGSVAGLLTTAPIPANSAVLVNYNSSFRYRGGHPRSYIVGGVQASMLNPNQWTSGFVASFETAFDSVFAAFSAGELDGTDYTNQCAVSYRLDDAYRTDPLVMPIAVYNVSSGIASMRRRMRK
jgi:hypothetical protein